ncbi:BQ2448_2440 [Microbotryum intermedium]|uniref:Protein phosphatase n=1 Tax=Microbotryum intermedium TaxID=269621 RepID=A0A238F6A8_9BASI|nr:BQ2448_2440 [Microbotryum intermedium]
MFLRPTGTSSIVHQLTHRVSQSVVVDVRLRAFASTPPESCAFVPSSALRRYCFEVAYAFKGKPGSPTYSSSERTDLTSSTTQRSVTDHELKSDDGNSSLMGDRNRDRVQSSFTRPDWRDVSATPRLQQGFESDHPSIVWRDSIWSRFPWGAGHDWFFVQEVEAKRKRSNSTLTESPPGKDLVIGVADGVGGWVDSGVDPSFFAQTLMWLCRQEVVKNGNTDPLKVIQNAYAAILKEKGVRAGKENGSSTACVLSFDAESGNLKAANLGDSIFLILRRKPASSPTPAPTIDSSSSTSTPDAPLHLTHSVVHMQAAQTHFFNAPRQLAKMPKGSNKQGALIDMPEGADLFETGLEDGDILVLATDGFSDNVWPQQLEELVALVQNYQNKLLLSIPTPDSRTGTPPPSPKKDSRTFARILADLCVTFAKICAVKPNRQSPFEIEARRYGHRDVRGGKVDDVCVVVVVVKKE